MIEDAPVVRLRELTRSFTGQAERVDALRGIDLDLAAGEYVAIRGASGSGKSTLLQIIGLLDRPSSGHYGLRGKPVEGLSDREQTRIRNEEIGFVFQSYHLLGDRTALENVQLPLRYRRSAAAPRDARGLLERLGLAHRASHRPGQMSGGEKQRVAIARALVKGPSLILFDEPTGNLDSETSLGILDLLDQLHRDEHATLLLVTHDAEVAARAERTLTIKDGQWIDD